MDDMFSFCVDSGKVSSAVEVRFIDNTKVRNSRVQTLVQIQGRRDEPE